MREKQVASWGCETNRLQLGKEVQKNTSESSERSVSPSPCFKGGCNCKGQASFATLLT